MLHDLLDRLFPTYRIVATVHLNGQPADCTCAEVLGRTLGVTYRSRRRADAEASRLQQAVEGSDLHPSTRYHVVEVP